MEHLTNIRNGLMDFFQFYLTEMGFISLILIIVSVAITIFLFRVRSKSRPSWLLLCFFCTVIANGITMLIANAWVHWGAMLMPAQDAWILLGGVALVQFAYHFPRYDQKQEARLVLAVTGSVALFAIGYSIYYIVQYLFYYSPTLAANQTYYLLMPLMTLFAIAIFLRRANYRASINTACKRDGIAGLHQFLTTLARPQEREARTLRDFALAISLGLLPGFAFILAPLPFIPGWLLHSMLSIGSVLAVSALALVYINSSGEQTSIIAKIMGISLVTFLLLYGAFGSSIIDRSQNIPKAVELGLSQSEKLSQTHDLVVFLAFWVILSSLIIIFLFPIFFRQNLVRPLDHLISGLRQVDSGELDFQIPVQYEDEIGALTHSFNNLVASLSKSNQDRDKIESELKQRIEELHLSEEKFYKAFHSSPLTMVLQNPVDSKYLDVNAAFTQVTGYPREDAIGRTPGELNLYPSKEEARRIAQALTQTEGCLRNFEFSFKQKTGQVGTGLLSSEIIELQDMKALLGIVMDITERKLADDNIRRLNAEMERRVAERSWQLSSLLDLAFLVGHQESSKHIFTPALEHLLKIGSLQVFCIHTYSSDKQILRLEAQVGLKKQEAEKMRLLLPTGKFAAWLGQPKDALLFSDLKANTILPGPMYPGRLRSCLMTQLVAQGEVLGMMSCYRQDVHTFSLEEVSLLVAVSAQLSISLENQRLRQEAEKAAITIERQRLARDVHDSITQSIYSLTLFARASQDALRDGNQEKLAASLEQVEDNALMALREMRLLLFQMQPSGLEGGFSKGINARLELVERRLGIRATCNIDEQIQLPPRTEETLFRVALEALNNSLKHAQAKQVRVSLESLNDAIILEVLDDGRGFDTNNKSDSSSTGMGLNNMQTRAAEIGAKLEIISSPGNGTRVRLVCDLISELGERSIG